MYKVAGSLVGGKMGPGHWWRPYETCDQTAMQLNQHTLMTGGHGEEGREGSQTVPQLNIGVDAQDPEMEGARAEPEVPPRCPRDAKWTADESVSSSAGRDPAASVTRPHEAGWVRGKRRGAQDGASRGHGKPRPPHPRCVRNIFKHIVKCNNTNEQLNYKPTIDIRHMQILCHIC